MAASDDPDDLLQHPEIFIAPIPMSATAQEVQQALAGNFIEVEHVQVRPGKGKRRGGVNTYKIAFARLCSREDLRRALAFSKNVFVHENYLKIFESDKTAQRNIPLGDPDHLAIMRLRSFSLGMCAFRPDAEFDRFLESWKEQPVPGIDAHAKCTFNFQKSLMHICFRPSQLSVREYDYKVRLHFRDLLNVVVIPPYRVYRGNECSALIFRFQCAPEVYRQDRVVGEEKSKDLWVRGDIEEERDWRRTTVSFCADHQTLGKYFDYLLVIPPDQRDEKQKLLDRLLRRSDWGYGEDSYKYDVTPEPKVPVVQVLTTMSSADERKEMAKRIPFSLLFLIEKMAGEGLIFHDLLDREFYSIIRRIASTGAQGVTRIRRALEHFRVTKTILDTPTEKLREALRRVDTDQDEGRYIIEQEEKRRAAQSSTYIPIYRVTIRPLTHFCWGPELDTPNRVLREYSHIADRFLRVTFTDENWDRLSKVGTDKDMHELLDGVAQKLARGLLIGDRHFEFLAVSNSQLREHSCWFFASDDRTSPDDIRRWMGNFEGIDIVAKYAARMGQCFSSTTTSGKLAVRRFEMEEVPDIIKGANGKEYNFSDGIGMISPKFAREAADLLGLEWLPSAFQIRFAGYKGVVSLDPTMPPHLKLRLRESMRKFNSLHWKLEVVRAATYQLGHLNREIILILSALGIKDDVFLNLQRSMLEDHDQAVFHDDLARCFINRSHEAGERLIAMLNGGFSVKVEPFLQAMVLAQRKSSLKQLEEKTHIACHRSACLMGVLDESGFLKYGQIFLQIRRNNEKDCRTEQIRGNVAVAKNPCLHPGDLRVLEAVDPNRLPKGHRLLQMVNCLVFPSKGPRPHPDECSGSDLDGDLYFVTWNHELVPHPSQVVEPMDYSPAPAERAPSGHVMMDDICKFVIKYMQNDQLGQICNWHMANADLSPYGVKDPICMELAKQASVAVDYPKTGVPAKKKRDWQPRSFPDFMKKSDKLSHPSKKVLGKLFREVQDVVQAQHRGIGQPSQWSAVNVLMDTLEKHFDQDLIMPGFEAHLREAKLLKESYDHEMRSIMRKYSTFSEAEVIGGYLLELPRLHRRRTLYDVQSFARVDTADLHDRYYDLFLSVPTALRQSKNAIILERYYMQKASAWYVVSYHKDHVRWPKKGPHDQKRHPLVSFAWVALPYLTEIKAMARLHRIHRTSRLSRARTHHVRFQL